MSFPIPPCIQIGHAYMYNRSNYKLRQFSSVCPRPDIPRRVAAEAVGTSLVQPRHGNRSDRLFPPTMPRCEISLEELLDVLSNFISGPHTH